MTAAADNRVRHPARMKRTNRSIPGAERHPWCAPLFSFPSVASSGPVHHLILQVFVEPSNHSICEVELVGVTANHVGFIRISHIFDLFA